MFPLAIWTVLILLAGLAVVNADLPRELPVQASAELPALLLELGSEARQLEVGGKSLQAVSGVVAFHEGDSSISIDKNDISSLHPGFGAWKVGFRFKLKSAIAAATVSILGPLETGWSSGCLCSKLRNLGRT